MPVEISVLLNIYSKDDLSLLDSSIKSILNQTFLPTELLVVSDGPATSSQLELLNSNLKPNLFPIRILQTPAPQGLWAARNFGLENSKTKYVALMDADDVMHPERLKLQSEFLEKHHEVAVLGTSVVEIDSNSKLIMGFKQMLNNHEDISTRLRYLNPLAHSSVLVDREVVIGAGGYKNFFLAEDYELWTRLVGQGFKFANLNYALLGFHVSDDFYRRRGSLKFISEEVKLRKQVIKNLNIQFNYQQVVILIFRIFYRISFPMIRKLIYRKILSTKVKEFDLKTEADFLSRRPELLN